MDRVNFRYKSERESAYTDEQEQIFLQTLNHIRHDWLNDIQVLYGYLKLRKYDKMQDFMETIKQKMARESEIARLGLRSLILYFSTFRARHRSVRFEIELENDFQLTSLPIRGEAVSELIVSAAETFVRHAGIPEDGGQNQLKLSFSADDGQLSIAFEYEGQYERSALEGELEGSTALYSGSPGASIGGTYNEDKAVVTIRVPFDREDEVRHVSG